MTKTYRVFFHEGQELGLKTRVQKGEASLTDESLSIRAKDGSLLTIPKSDLRAVEMFRLHGLGRVIRIDMANGRLFISVIRFMIGQFATINFFGTGELHQRLREWLN